MVTYVRSLKVIKIQRCHSSVYRLSSLCWHQIRRFVGFCWLDRILFRVCLHPLVILWAKLALSYTFKETHASNQTHQVHIEGQSTPSSVEQAVSYIPTTASILSAALNGVAELPCDGLLIWHQLISTFDLLFCLPKLHRFFV